MKQITLTVLLIGCFAIGSLCAQDAQEKSSTGSSTAVAGEPSSQEMRDAVQAKLDAYNDSMKRKIDACKNGDVQGNPVLAAQCLAVYAGGSNGKSDYMIKITKFKKIACASAQAVGKPGYNCDYVLNLSENTPALLGALGITTRSGGTTKGRFVREDDSWTLITDTD